MAVLYVAFSNLKRKKGVVVSMALLILLASTMLNVGITLLAGIGSFYDRANDRMKGAHYVVRFTGNDYSEDYLDYLKNDPRVETAQTEEIVLMDMAAYPQGGVVSVNFKRIDENASIKGYSLSHEADVPEKEAVYVPLFMREMGYAPGDTLVLQFNKQDYEFRIAGYSQSTWFSSSLVSLIDIYMPESAYQELYGKIGGGCLISVRLKDPADTQQLREDFKNKTDVPIEAVTMDSAVMDFSEDELKGGSTMVVTTLSTVLFAFAFLMVAVAVLVMRFRILNHIEQQMSNIGAMQALGYTGRQIQWSIALEFLIIGIGAGALGVLLSYAVIAALGGLISNSVGVSFSNTWNAGFDLFSMASVMGVVLLTAFLSAAKAAKLTPVDALRGGIKPHSFKRNHFSLERFGHWLIPALGMKHFFFQKKLYGMIGVIFAGITFAGAFAVMIWQNLGADDTLLLRLSGYEVSDIIVYTAPHADYDRLKAKLEAVEGVRKTNLYESESVEVEGELLTCSVSDDFDLMEMLEVYEGNFPQYDNEIVVTGVLAQAWGKEIGDTVKVSQSGSSRSYVICGLTQTMNNFGRQCFMNQSGLLRIKPYYTPKSMQLYLEPGIDVAEQIRKLEQEFKVISPATQEAAELKGSPEERAKEAAAKRAEEKLAVLLSKYGVDSAQYALMADGELVLSGDTSDYEIDRIENNRAMFVSNVNSISAAAGLMSLMILAGAGCMIALVFYMVIKSMLVRRKKEFGIYRAVGYTDGQLMNMIASGFLLPAFAGVTAGSVAACFAAGPLISALLKSLGISKLALSVNPWLIAGMGTGILLFSYAVAVTVAGGIRKFSVYGLMTEE